MSELKVLAIISLAVAGGVFIYNSVVQMKMDQESKTIKKDPATGIIEGAEPIKLIHNNSNQAALLIHGYIGAPSDYGRLPKMIFEQGYDVYVPLLPGHGTNPRDFSKVTADLLEQFVKDELSRLRSDYDEVVLIGFSMGGALSVLASQHVDVDRLVLLAPYFSVKHEWYYLLPAEILQKLFQNIIPYTYRPMAFKQIRNREMAGFIKDYRYVSLKGSGAAIELAKRARSDSHRFKQPTLVIHSQFDKAADYLKAKKIVQHHKDSENIEFITVNNSNHLLMWDYDRAEIEQHILKFLKP